MSKTVLYGGAAVLAVGTIGLVWYFSRKSATPGNSPGAVNAANKAPVGQAGQTKTGSNAYDFGVAIAGAGASVLGAYLKSGSADTQV